MQLFHTSGLINVCYAHIVLASTEKNSCQFTSWAYLTKDFHIMLENFEEQGWSVVKKDGQGYLLQKDNNYRSVILDRHMITGYDIVIVGDEFDDISEWRTNPK